jgi:hypothetical protein
VNVDPSMFDRSCVENIDCTEVTTGMICSPSCFCGGTLINSGEQARYNALVSGIKDEGCPCISAGFPRCIQNTCTLCALDGTGAPGCGDGG